MIIQILSNAHSRRVFYRENDEVKVRQFAADATDKEINAAVSTTDSDIAEKPALAASSISPSVERTSQASPAGAKSQPRPTIKPSQTKSKQTTKGKR